MLKRLFHSIVLISLLAAVAEAQNEAAARLLAGQAPSTRPLDLAARQQFLTIERIARLPLDAQAAEVPELYHDLFPPLAEVVSRESMLSSTFPPEKVLTPRDRTAPPRDGDYGQELETVVTTMTPEQVADTILSNHGGSILRRAALQRLEYVLRQHLPELDKLINEDLSSSDPAISPRAFTVISEMRLKEYVEPVTVILIAGGPRDLDARKALSWMQSDPAAAKPFLADLSVHPAAIARYHDLLRVMLFHQPPDPVLLKLMDSPDAAVRRGTAIVLEETDSNSAIDLVPKLTSDPDQEVRLCGYRMAFRLPDELLNIVRGSLIPALKSPAIEERLTVATGFAGKRDPIGAPVLLDAMKDAQLATQLRGQVSISVNHLLQTRYPTHLNLSDWGTNNPQNAQIIAQFQQWMALQQK